MKHRMAKRKTRRTSKTKAIQAALGQLGWHTSGKDVVAFLANFGMDVDEGLVHKVKLDTLKGTKRTVQQKAKVPQSGQRPKTTTVRKLPTRRTYRR